jgi:hypothetical protein
VSFHPILSLICAVSLVTFFLPLALTLSVAASDLADWLIAFVELWNLGVVSCIEIPDPANLSIQMGEKRVLWVGVQIGELPFDGVLTIIAPLNHNISLFKKKVQEEYKARFGKAIFAPGVS